MPFALPFPLPFPLPTPQAAALAAALDRERKIERALEALGPVAGRDVAIVGAAAAAADGAVRPDLSGARLTRVDSLLGEAARALPTAPSTRSSAPGPPSAASIRPS